MITFGNFVGGRWIAGRDRIDVINPATESKVGAVGAGCMSDVDSAVAAANAALPAWSTFTPTMRASYLRSVADILEAKADQIARLICSEVGMPIKLCRHIQTDLPIAVLRSTAQVVEAHQFERTIAHSTIYLEPIGVIAAITPWNYPLHQIVAKLAPALAAGCTLVLKPSELAPLNAMVLAAAFEEAQLPAGVLNVVNGRGDIGQSLAQHAGVSMISFTGSSQTGRGIASDAGRSLRKVSLELGGKSAALVLEDGDLAKAVKATVSSCFLNSGQTCSAFTRLIVPEDRLHEASRLAAEAASSFRVGDPLDPEVRLGPVISETQRERVWGFIRAGLESQAILVTGGEGPPDGAKVGYFVKPTIFSDVDPQATIAQDEIFGPVLCILGMRNERHGIEIANGTRYGLAAAVWSSTRASEVARHLEAGQIDLNGARFNPLAPFGGVKDSGWGRELGLFGLEEFLLPKSVQHPI